MTNKQDIVALRIIDANVNRAREALRVMEEYARLGLDEHVRLACQLKPSGPISVRRLVLDETDLRMCSQLDREVASRTGEVTNVTIFFSDIVNFTGLSEQLLAYDVMYLLNRYFIEAGDIVERNGGYIDKFIGDGMMAIFGADGRLDAVGKRGSDRRDRTGDERGGEGERIEGVPRREWRRRRGKGR